MNIIWAFGNNKKEQEFQLSKIEIMSAFTSVILWNHFYPEDKTFLYCDKIVESYFKKIGLLEIWDVIDTKYLSKPNIFNKETFWTVDKIKILEHHKPPFVFMDLDFYIKKKLPEFTKFDLVTAFEEYTIGYYPNYYDKKFKDLELPEFEYFRDTAYNTCFYYCNKLDIMEAYPKLCLSNMELINNMEGITGSDSIFLEQHLLAAMALKNNWNYSPLINQQFNIKDRVWMDSKPNGFFTNQESFDYFRHLDIDKKLTYPDIKLLEIQSEIISLIKMYEPSKLLILHKILQCK
jgi:hypothetical protein